MLQIFARAVSNKLVLAIISSARTPKLRSIASGQIGRHGELATTVLERKSGNDRSKSMVFVAARYANLELRKKCKLAILSTWRRLTNAIVEQPSIALGPRGALGVRAVRTAATPTRPERG